MLVSLEKSTLTPTWVPNNAKTLRNASWRLLLSSAPGLFQENHAGKIPGRPPQGFELRLQGIGLRDVVHHGIEGAQDLALRALRAALRARFDSGVFDSWGRVVFVGRPFRF